MLASHPRVGDLSGWQILPEVQSFARVDLTADGRAKVGIGDRSIFINIEECVDVFKLSLREIIETPVI